MQTVEQIDKEIDVYLAKIAELTERKIVLLDMQRQSDMISVNQEIQLQFLAAQKMHGTL